MGVNEKSDIENLEKYFSIYFRHNLLKMAATVTKSLVSPSQNSAKRKQATPSLGVQLLTAGSAACFADLITFPLDTVKVRQQVQSSISITYQGDMGAVVKSRGVFGTLSSIARFEGIQALYCGLVPGLQRQMVFSALRIGLYERVRNTYMELCGVEGGLGWGMLGVRMLAGVTTGSLAIMVAQPMDVVKIRMQAAGGGSQYSRVTDAYINIAKKEGLSEGLYRGLAPNIVRNGIVNVCETVVYDVVKESFIASRLMQDGIVCHFSSALVAGFTATLVASPVDVIKTRYMNSSQGQYRNVIHCAVKTARQEGAVAFYKGFTASCMRIVSWNIVLWMTYEQLKKTVNMVYSNRD